METSSPAPPRTKIVATLGPASASPEMIRKFIAAGMDVARINASHGDHDAHARLIQMVRAEATAQHRTVGILFDLQGPKIRLGRFEGDARRVARGDTFTLAVGRPPEGDELPCDYPLLDRDVAVGHALLIDDGSLACEVIEVAPGRVRVRAQDDGEIAPRKGINLPQSCVSAPAVTARDRVDALFAVEQQVDLIAQSFVRQGSDLDQLRALLDEVGSAIPIVAKIEKPQALDNLGAILERCWGVMVARGDLGVELPPEDVPLVQKRIIQEAGRLGRPVITATQMLDSMMRHPRPTRAEASDVANAVLDRTDAVMLSGETASGRYPLESLQMMNRIVHATERGQDPQPIVRRREREIDSVPEAVADSACQVAYHLNARCIVAFTLTGRTALLVSRRRPRTPILAFSPHQATCNRLSLAWGVEPHRFSPTSTSDQLIIALNKRLVADHLAAAGDLVVLLMGAPTDGPGHTNRLILRRVGEEDHL